MTERNWWRRPNNCSLSKAEHMLRTLWYVKQTHDIIGADQSLTIAKLIHLARFQTRINVRRRNDSLNYYLWCEISLTRRIGGFCFCFSEQFFWTNGVKTPNWRSGGISPRDAVFPCQVTSKQRRWQFILHKEIVSFPATNAINKRKKIDMALAKQNFSRNAEDAINQQIQVEQTASQTYQAIAAWFARDNVALPVSFSNNPWGV